MTKIAGFIRRSLLTLFLVQLLILCVTKLDRSSDIGAFLYFGVTLSLGGFIAFSFLSIIIRLNRLKIMDESDAMKKVYNDVFALRHNSTVIHYFRRVAFWGSIMLIINIFILKVPFNNIYGGPYSPNLYLKRYHGFLLWSLISLVFMFIVTLLNYVFYLPHYGIGAYNIFQYTGRIILSGITAPIRVITKFLDRGEKKKFSHFINLITMVIFIIINVLAIIKTI